MRIERIQIAEFGPFQQVEFGPFSNQFTVIQCPDEAGKSTIQAFVRAILFGFQATGISRTKLVASSGRYGGRLVVRNKDNEQYIIERFLDVDDGRASVRRPNETRADETLLSALLGDISSDLYQSVFAFGIRDLQTNESSPADVTSRRIHTADPGMQGLSEEKAQFQHQADEIFRSAGRIEPIARQLNDLDQVERELSLSRLSADKYYQLLHQRREIDLELRTSEQQLSSMNQAEQRIAEESWRLSGEEDRLAQAMARLEEYDRDFPRQELPEKQESPEAEDARMRQEIAELRESWTRLQATRRMAEVYQGTIVRQRVPRNAWFVTMLIFGALIPAIVGVAIGQTIVISIGIASAALGMIASVLATIARSRFETAQFQARLHLELTHREVEGRFLHTAMAAGIDPEHVEEELQRLERNRAELHNTTEKEMTSYEREILREERVRAVAEAGDAVEERAGELEKARASWRAIVAESGLPDELHGTPVPAVRAVEERRNALLIERGRLDEQLEQLASDHRAAALRMQKQELIARLRKHTREWAINIAAARLSSEVVDLYEISRKPEVLEAASDIFDSMTLGAYHQILVSDGNEDLIALSRDGQSVPVSGMSRETREQAYFALRIGLIRAIGERGRALPVLIDDILADFHPAGAAEAARALAGLASKHQVLMFTCHPATVGLARFVMPGMRVISLGGQKIGEFAPIRIDTDS